MAGDPHPTTMTPAPVHPGIQDLESLRLGGWSVFLGLAALGAGAGYVVYVGLLIAGYVAAVVFATIGIVAGAAAGRRHARSGPRDGWVLPATGIVFTFAAPVILVFGLGLASRGEEWALLVSLIPGCLVIGAHVSLLEAARAVRGWTVPPVWLVLAAIAGGVGPLLSVLALYSAIRYPSAPGVGLALTAMGLAFDGVLLLWANRERRRGSVPWPAEPLPPG